MPISHDHYNLQEQRGYPLADGATGVGNDGEFLPHDLLADCRLRFPSTAGRYAFLGGVTVNDNIVTVVILAADSPSSVTNFTPLASLSLAKPVQPGRYYQVSPLYPGVGGWCVFGPGIGNRFIGRFSGPSQSLLAPRAAIAGPPLPIPSLGRLGEATALAGIVGLVGGTDVEVVKEQHVVGDVLRDAIVIRLVGDTPGENPLQKYLPECGGRPESGTCVLPGIEFINGVSPDCDGNINIVFEDLTIAPYAALGPGITLDHGLGLDDACPDPQPPSYVDDCVEERSSVGSESSEGSVSESSVSTSSESVSCALLPVLFDFDVSPPELIAPNGRWGYEDVVLEESESSESGSSGRWLVASSGSTKNIVIWDNCGGAPTVDRRVSAGMQVLTTNPDRNAGIILNYHTADPLTSPHIAYFLVLLDLNVNKIRVLRFNGLNHVEEYVSPSALPLIPGDWYEMIVEITESPPTQHALAVTVNGITTPSFTAGFSMLTSRYGDTDDGRFGLGTIRGASRFSYLQIEEL